MSSGLKSYWFGNGSPHAKCKHWTCRNTKYWQTCDPNRADISKWRLYCLGVVSWYKRYLPQATTQLHRRASNCKSHKKIYPTMRPGARHRRSQRESRCSAIETSGCDCRRRTPFGTWFLRLEGGRIRHWTRRPFYWDFINQFKPFSPPKNSFEP